jgi:DNA modification methylase
MESRSRISKEDYFRWFTPIWADITGASTKHHPAPYPLEIPRRLVCMYSFAGDTVVDPFAGLGTTACAAALMDRHSISFEIEPAYHDDAVQRFLAFQESTSRLVNEQTRAAGQPGNSQGPQPLATDATA